MKNERDNNEEFFCLVGGKIKKSTKLNYFIGYDIFFCKKNLFSNVIFFKI